MIIFYLFVAFLSGAISSKVDSVAFIKDLQKSGLSSPLLKITNGIEAQPHEFPFQVALRFQSPFEKAFCGGSLISNEYVLTAAHCVEGMTLATIYLGINNLNADEPGEVVHIVDRSHMTVHEEWNSLEVRNDLALIKLAAPVEFNEYISPINLPRKSEVTSTFEYDTAIASGWGVMSDRIPGLSAALRYITVTIIGNDRCKRSLGSLIHPTNICISGAGGKSTCSGDSGGPLTVIEEDGSKTLVGITSFGTARGCQTGSAAAFTRVSSYLNWIAQHANIELRQ